MLGTRVSCAKTDKPIVSRLGRQDRVDARNHVLGGVDRDGTVQRTVRCNVHWENCIALGSPAQRPQRTSTFVRRGGVGNAAFIRFILGTCFFVKIRVFYDYLW